MNLLVETIKGDGWLLLTGATGFLGTQIARRIIKYSNWKLIAIVRASDRESARLRLKKVWWDFRELKEVIDSRIEVVCADISNPRLGLESGIYSGIAQKVRCVIHAAADIRFDSSIEKLRQINEVGTQNLLDIASAAHKDHGIHRFSFISTAYVAGRRSGDISEESLSDELGFSSLYEASKFKAEKLVRAAISELPISIFRPGMVVGDSQTGEIKTFNTVYLMLRLFLTGRMRIIPADPKLPINLIPVDYVADAIVNLTFMSEAIGRGFHLTPPIDFVPTASDFLSEARIWAAEHLDLHLKEPIFIPLPIILPKVRNNSRRDNPRAKKSRLSLVTILLPYMKERKQFLRENVNELLGQYTLSWHSFFDQMLRYAVRRGFLHRSERALPEQIVYRLRSRNLPVSFYEIGNSKVKKYEGVEVLQTVLAISRSLQEMGVRPGESISLSGPSTVRRFAVEVGAGLLGAIIEPIDENDRNRDSSLHVVEKDGAIYVSRTRSELEKSSNFSESFDHSLNWPDFLALANSHETNISYVVSLDDISLKTCENETSTSVELSHGRARALAESLAESLPWRTRTKPVSYLSFAMDKRNLPAILVESALFNLPAPVDIYYCSDGEDCFSVLRKIKPSILLAPMSILAAISEKLESSRAEKRQSLSKSGARKTIGNGRLLGKLGIGRCINSIFSSEEVEPELVSHLVKLGIKLISTDLS